MELIRGIHNIKKQQHHSDVACVATIGNFDGVHLGHQAVIGQLAEKSDELNLPMVVICFEPQPMEYFLNDKAPARLSRFREKWSVLSRFSVTQMLSLPFNKKLAAMSAQDFIQEILIDGLGVQFLVVGDDFKFGHNRQGDFELLQQAGKKNDFKVVNMHSFEIDGERVSSTRIRKALQNGDLQYAEKLLGRSYRMSGRVAHGDKLGRELGFPTANIFLHRKVTPMEGIFAVEVFGIDGEPISGVASIGKRPTVNGSKILLEVYMFDFDQNIYGKHLQVSFLHKFRDQIRFDNLDDLTTQIKKDVEQTKQFFSKLKN
ncbi:FMN adenylyltransferase / Riboflavin kinase [hydrothermal vent metagenome]|uniref:Bifunctional riboflavin kinase/FMN adenylyltransferase n=1 Tax=hydrothermal vent metagenome TaxID=652676 RepID=A0A3B1AP74_9ZZZZ